jgi:hypothetical protein
VLTGCLIAYAIAMITGAITLIPSAIGPGHTLGPDVGFRGARPAVTAGGAVTSLVNTAVNAVVTGTWLVTGTYTCSVAGGAGWLMVMIGSKSTPQIPVQCG